MKTALYIRSSKDRADVAIEAQRAELTDYAKSKGWTIVVEHSDVEVSGALDEVSRPGFLALHDDIKNRRVECVLALDTSRIARDQMLSAEIDRACHKAGVALCFKNMPVDSSTPEGKLHLNHMRGYDQYHSEVSALKGRMGMMQNVRQGFRAGGRPPYGYLLKHHKTGAVRDGEPVTKSKLVLDKDHAPLLRRYLKARIAGNARVVAIAKSGIKLTAGTLVGIERNAWTYAGFTTWNRRQKVKPSRTNPHQRMLPRKESEHVRHPTPTHKALITPDEAELLMALPMQQQRRTDPTGETLLADLLYTPDGQRYALSDRGHSYRVRKGRRFNRKEIDAEVLARITAASENDDFVARAFNAAQALANQLADSNPAQMRTKLAAIDAKIKRLVDAIAEGGAMALGRKIGELEIEKAHVADLLAHVDETEALKKALRQWNKQDVAAFFTFAAGSKRLDPGTLRQRVRDVVERVVLCPATGTLAVHYALPVARLRYESMASPRGFEPLYSP